MKWVWLGDRAVRFDRPRSSARAIVSAVRAWPGVVDVVVTEDDVAAYFDRAPEVPDVSLDDLSEGDEQTRTIELSAVYDGPDLEVVAKQTKLAVEEIVRLHRRATYVVEMMGFAPGFAYMSGLDPRLRLPRKSTPRTRVPAGSIGIAGKYTGVYPFDSPGGWHLLGRVKERMFDGQPLLRLGDRVRFV
jgi:KipI family sensor histidine kinase inhibitor